MQRLKHYTIPVFTPEMACPFQCVFCNQQKISGHTQSPDFQEVTNTIRTWLASFKAGEKHVEVGFFGGTFTGIPTEIQENYLRTVQPFLDSGEVQGIRLSTRPDYISGEILTRLKKYRVSTIELGAQSLDDTVLRAARRGHTVRQVEEACALIHAAGIDLGLQMMIGLPGDTLEKSMATAQKIIDLGASNTRIYPALVIKETVLYRWFQQGKYKPLSLEEAVAWSKHLLLKFEDSGVRVIRMGLHPSEGLLDGSEWVAGPFHPSFRELVLTEIWHDMFTSLVAGTSGRLHHLRGRLHHLRGRSHYLLPLLKKNTLAQADACAMRIEIEIPVEEINYAIGYGGKNKKMLLEHFREVRFTPDPHLSARNFKVKDKVSQFPTFVSEQNYKTCFKPVTMNKPQHILTAAFLLLSSVVVSQNLHHEMKAVLNIDNSTIHLTDTIRFPDAFVAGHDSLIFYLNPHLTVKLTSGEFRLVKTARQDKQPDALRYALLKTGQNTGKAVLESFGKIDDSLSSGAAEYARGFSETKGIISKKGVYLAASTYWMPTFDTPLFTFNLTTQLPAGWLVVSQGVRTENDTANGIRTVRYECRYPQEQVYLTANRWTEYDTKAGNVVVQAFLRTPDKKLAMRYLNMTGIYLNMYVHLLGPYPYSKFALVENFWETGYGMPSFTLLGSRIIRFPFILYSSYPHELLHNWWGNSVYVAMGKGNWSEGLTAYMADHMLKEQRGQGAEYRRNTLQKFTDFVNPENDFPVVDFRDRHNAAEEAIGYGKSLMFQHMLRQRVGDSLYILAYRQFYKDYRFKIASFDDIRTTFTKVTGRDFKPFFKEWLTRKGAPQLTLGDVKVRKPNNDYLLSFRLSQIQKEKVFPLVVPVAVYFADTVIMRKIHMKNREMYPLLTFHQQPLRLEIDPQFDLFRRLDKGEAPPTLSQLYGNVKGTLILPANSPYLTEYEKLAKIWKQTQEIQKKSLTVVFDNNLKQLPVSGAVWVIGFKNKFAHLFNVQKNYARYFNTQQLKKINGLHRTGALVYAIPNPENKGQTIGFVGVNIKGSVSGLTRLLPHYGKYSWLGFEGSRPNNVMKGTFPPLHSPLHYDIPVKGKRPVIKAKLKPEPPLIY